MTPVRLGHRLVGPGHPSLIVAELSANHAGSLDRALAIVRAAATAGADAIKLQTYTADTLTIDCPRPEFTIRGGPWDGYALYRLYQEAHTPWAWHPRLFALAAELGLLCFSTPFDHSAIAFLEPLAPPCYKLASFELVDLPLIRALAATRRPLIASTGMASLEEITEAVVTFRTAGGQDLILLSCVSAYPAPAAESRLKRIGDLGLRFGVPTGLSDHSPGHAMAVAATTLGGCVIEKHLTSRRADGGPDAAFSLEPSEFAALVQAVRDTEAALGPPSYGRSAAEEGSLVFRRSLFVVADCAAGEPFTPANLRIIRPGHGLPPRHFETILGRRATRAIARGTPLSWDLVEGGEPQHG